MLFGMLLVLPGCIAMPESEKLVYEPRGLPLAPTDEVVAFVSEEARTGKAGDYPINDAGLVRRAFEEGFHKVRADIKVQWADKGLYEACFEKSREAEDNRSVRVVSPDLGAAGCRALVDRRGARYVISIGGLHTISSWTFSNAEGHVGNKHAHTFALGAHVFDAAGGKSVCNVNESNSGESQEFVALLLFIPIAGARLLDESFFWKDVAVRTGYGIGGCFVEPGAGKPGDSGARSQ